MSPRVEHLAEGVTRFREVTACRSCHWTWRPDPNGGTRQPCPHCGEKRDVRHRKYVSPGMEKLKAWRATQPGYSTKWDNTYRKRSLMLVGRGDIRCVRCGCNDVRLIEINHKEGGGGKEHRALSHRLDRAIALMRRGVDDLELLCRPCNAVHWLETRFGPLPIKVVWEGGHEG